MEMFKSWSGLKINLSKTYLTVYKARFDPEKYSMCMFTRYLKYKIDYFALVSLNLKLGCLLVSSVLQKYNNDANYDK